MAKRSNGEGMARQRDDGRWECRVMIGYKPNGKPDYKSKVKYWMPFNGNLIGLHDASWRTKFGGSIYKSDGSHGCVNLPSGKAADLYDLIRVGDVVCVHS